MDSCNLLVVKSFLIPTALLVQLCLINIFKTIIVRSSFHAGFMLVSCGFHAGFMWFSCGFHVVFFSRCI